MTKFVFVNESENIFERFVDENISINKSSKEKLKFINNKLYNNYIGCFQFRNEYNLIKLVYYEYFEHIEKAIVREKQLKDMNRNDKLKLIYNFNPSFSDLWNEIVEKYK